MSQFKQNEPRPGDNLIDFKAPHLWMHSVKRVSKTDDHKGTISSFLLLFGFVVATIVLFIYIGNHKPL